MVLNAKNHENEADIIANAGKEKSVIITTSISGRGVDIQLGGKKGSIQEDQLKTDKNKIKSLGGLFVIGTERMESRRVDNQARGRSGRQGDEGSSIFYVSLEDDLMRIFGSESMNKILAIDYGTKRVGLAETDTQQIIASGLTTVLTSDLMNYLANDPDAFNLFRGFSGGAT